MEFDRALGEEHPPDSPLIRFYTWDKATISYGCNQNPAKRLDLEQCCRAGIPVVKRPTGGRELLHGHDICYTAAIPAAMAITGTEAKRIFANVTGVLISALRDMGIDARWSAFCAKPKLVDGPCFVQADSGEITVGGRKLAASAQRVYARCLIQQGSIPIHRPIADLSEFLRSGDRQAIRRRIDEMAAYLADETKETLSLSSIVTIFEEAFASYYGAEAGPAAEIISGFSRNNSNSRGYYL
jgi:lipoate-protein ligase A